MLKHVKQYVARQDGVSKRDWEVTARDLERGADYLDKHGWCIGQNFDQEGRCCAMGAIHGGLKGRAASIYLAEHRAVRAAGVGSEYLAGTADVNRHNDVSLVTFNDGYATSGGQVSRALRRSAAALRKAIA